MLSSKVSFRRLEACSIGKLLRVHVGDKWYFGFATDDASMDGRLVCLIGVESDQIRGNSLIDRVPGRAACIEFEGEVAFDLDVVGEVLWKNDDHILPGQIMLTDEGFRIVSHKARYDEPICVFDVTTGTFERADGKGVLVSQWSICMEGSEKVWSSWL